MKFGAVEGQVVALLLGLGKGVERAGGLCVQQLRFQPRCALRPWARYPRYPFSEQRERLRAFRMVSERIKYDEMWKV